VTQEQLERKYRNTPSWGLYPEFDSRSLRYKDMKKLEDVAKVPAKRFIELHQPQLGSEITIDEIAGIPMPLKEEFDWSRITNREVRVILMDFRTQEYISNSFIAAAQWK